MTQICHFKVYTSVAVIVFTMCIIITTVLKLFHHPKQKLCPLDNNFSFSSLQPLVTSNLLFVCTNLCIKSKIFYVSGIIQYPSILSDLFFTEHNVFKFHPYCSMCLNFSPFYVRVILLVLHLPNCVCISFQIHQLVVTWMDSSFWLLWKRCRVYF